MVLLSFVYSFAAAFIIGVTLTRNAVVAAILGVVYGLWFSWRMHKLLA